MEKIEIIPEQGVLRPPSESRSLLVRVVRGCPWNKCAFCPAYKNEKFSLRPLEEVIYDVDQLALKQDSNRFDSAFLQDGDALVAPVENLIRIIEQIRSRFPEISRITAYSRSRTLAARKIEELQKLKAAGLGRIHIGLETANDKVLELVNKGVDSETQLKGCLNAKEAGLEICCYYMPGLGGKAFSNQHADNTAALIRKVSPHHVRLRTCIIIENTGLEKIWREGLMVPLSEEEAVQEIKRFIEGIKDTHTNLISDHRINLLLELRGRLPDEYSKLMDTIENFESLSSGDKKLFIAGRRTGQIKILAELNHAETRKKLEEIAKKYVPALPVSVSILF